MKSKKILSLLVSLSILGTSFLSVAPVQAATIKNTTKSNVIAKSINPQNFSVSITPSYPDVHVTIKSLDGSSHNYMVYLFFSNGRRYVGDNLVYGSGTELDKSILPNNGFIYWYSASVEIKVDNESLISETVYS